MITKVFKWYPLFWKIRLDDRVYQFSMAVYNKLLQTQCLKTTDIYCFSVLSTTVWISVAGPKSRCPPTSVSVAAATPWFVATSLQSSKPASVELFSLSSHTWPFLRVCQNSRCFLLVRTLMMVFRAYPDNPEQSSHLKFLNLITFERSFFNIR